MPLAPNEEMSQVWFGGKRGEKLKELVERIAGEIRKANNMT
jgi:hypothetical protein